MAQIEQFEDIKESDFIQQLAADNEAGNAGVIANPVLNAASGQFGEASSSTMAQS